MHTATGIVLCAERNRYLETMSKNKAKWYNPTGNPTWDDYYQMFYILFTPIMLMMLALIVAGIVNEVRS